MRKKTSIRNIANVLCYDPMAQIVKAEYQYNSWFSPNKEDIEAITMLESISSLEDNVVFANIVDWTYENVSEATEIEDIILYGDLREIIGTNVVIHLRATNNHTVEHVVNELDKKYTFNIQNITE